MFPSSWLGPSLILCNFLGGGILVGFFILGRMRTSRILRCGIQSSRVGCQTQGMNASGC